MLKFADYKQLDGIAAAEGIRRKDFSSAELTAAAIERAEEINPTLNAIVHEHYEGALEQAKLIDQSPQLARSSRVAGLPFLIKDLTEVAGLPCTYGSALYADHVSQGDADIVARYRAAGLLILGKTNTPEFGLTITTEARANGACRNPWNLEHSTGGSSGGAAAAVAAGIVPVAHASDGGGSIRIPASCCGLFGLKPSRGLSEVGQTLGESWGGMSVAHVLSRSVRDSAAFLDLITLGRPKLYPLPAHPASFFDTLLEGDAPRLRIAFQLTHPGGEAVEEDCLRAVKRAASHCEALGHQVEELPQPVDYESAARAMARLINVYAYQAVGKRAKALGLDLDDCPLESSTLAMSQRGAKICASDFLDARDSLMEIEQQVHTFHQRFDVIIQPVLAKPPAKIGWLDMNSADLKDYAAKFKAYSGFTALANGTGQPSMSVPMGLGASGLPNGALFTAAWGGDMTLLQLAAELERAAPWPGLADPA